MPYINPFRKRGTIWTGQYKTHNNRAEVTKTETGQIEGQYCFDN